MKLDDGERGDIWTRELGKCEQYGTELAPVLRGATVLIQPSGGQGLGGAVDGRSGVEIAAVSLRNEPPALFRSPSGSPVMLLPRACQPWLLTVHFTFSKRPKSSWRAVRAPLTDRA